jgi:hypothetical protein
VAYRENWLRHLVSVLRGESYSNELAHDFTREDLWDPRKPVRARWSKLVFVYFASALTQTALPVMLVGTLITLFQDEGSMFWWCIGAGVTTLFGLLTAIVIGTATYVGIEGKRKVQ